MTTAPCLNESVAHRRARENHRANCDELDVSIDLLELEWTFARDGALSALDADERWIGGCSVPRRAAMTQLRKLELHGPVACFLAPPSAAALRVALDRLRPEQSCIAIVPDARDFHRIIHCDDFSDDLAAHRVFLVAGPDWSSLLKGLFEEFPGLSIPTQFIRLPNTSLDRIESLINESQHVFSQVTRDRAQATSDICNNWRRQSDRARLCIVAPSRRRLWNDWGAVLADAVAGDASVFRVDPHDPLQTSPFFVAKSASQCDAIVAIDLCRADVPGVVHEQLPWVTWITTRAIPKRSSCGAHDRLLLLAESDRAAAHREGWSQDEASVCVPKQGATLSICDAASGESFVAIVADTTSLEPPASIDDFSSHRVLWESIVDELLRNPFAINEDPSAYLHARTRKLQIGAETLNPEKFIESLVVPAYQQGIARVLMKSVIPLRIFGRGWQTIDATAQQADDREVMMKSLAGARAIVHVWPNPARAHAVDFASRPVIRPGRSAQKLLREAQSALDGRLTATTRCEPLLCADRIRQLLRSSKFMP